MVTAGVAPPPQHREAVEQRQAEVEHGGVVGLGLPEELGADAVAGRVHGVAGVPQHLDELVLQRRLVFHHQHAHDPLWL